jgi:DNA-binding MarR family transcriptional regulator
MTDIEPRLRVEPGFEEAWPGASALATECVLNLHVLMDEIEAFGQSVVRRHGIPSVAAFNALTILHGADGPLPPSVIAARMIITRPTMTGILGSLARRGLIARSPHVADRRMSLVEITNEGRARVERLLPALHQSERRWMACLSEEEQRTLLAMIARLQAHEPSEG